PSPSVQAGRCDQTSSVPRPAGPRQEFPRCAPRPTVRSVARNASRPCWRPLSSFPAIVRRECVPPAPHCVLRRPATWWLPSAWQKNSRPAAPASVRSCFRQPWHQPDTCRCSGKFGQPRHVMWLAEAASPASGVLGTLAQILDGIRVLEHLQQILVSGRAARWILVIELRFRRARLLEPVLLVLL